MQVGTIDFFHIFSKTRQLIRFEIPFKFLPYRFLKENLVSFIDVLDIKFLIKQIVNQVYLRCLIMQTILTVAQG